MTDQGTLGGRLDALVAAFDRDGYSVDRAADVLVHGDRIAIRATHRTATIGATQHRKKVYYLEGDAHTMGYLLGRLAADDVERMCQGFLENAPFEFVGVSDPTIRAILAPILLEIAYAVASSSLRDIPDQYKQELKGLLDGCREANPQTRVDSRRLWLMNIGIDALLAFAYTGQVPIGPPRARAISFPIRPENLRIPIMCNGFSAAGTNPLTNDRYHFMGRDFMFVTAGVFQDTAAMIIRKPDQGLPTVSVAAPGMLGTIAGLNVNGVGVGVDMSPGANCSVFRPGINSLLLTRHSIEHGATCEAAVDVMASMRRGVTWDYVLADGQSGRSCIVEAGMTAARFDALKRVDSWVLAALRASDPGFDARLQRLSAPYRNGVMVRWSDYAYPSDWADLNPALIEAYRQRNPSYAYQYDPDDFRPGGYLDKTGSDRNCPGPYYFAPQRAQLPGLVLVTNQFIIPEMRLYAMHEWVAGVAAEHFDDVQWRYDELSHRLVTVLDKGYMTYEEAKATISFLAPPGASAGGSRAEGATSDDFEIGGSVSLMDLRARTIETHYGYYGDQWIKLSLPAYVGV